MNPAGIYISIPFCRQKCSYCNFASDVHASSLLPRYLNALAAEITQRSELWKKAGVPGWEDIRVDTIYMGGGTPGLLDFGQLSELLRAVRTSFDVEEDAEITIEASPENVTPSSAAAWAASGVNRLSLGVQSMVREELRAVGRMHDAATVAEACRSLRTAGIHNISGDLIAGLPYQTAESWESSLQSLLALDLAHLSIYMLEVDDDSRLGREMMESGSRYHAGEVPSEERVADFYCTAMELLHAAEFEHYEISNFARPGKVSRHNLKYWTHAPYFGFGVDAHSYDGERRWANTDSLGAYLDLMEKGESPVVDLKLLCAREKREERLFLGLRRREGVSLSQLDAELAADIGHGTELSAAARYAEPIREFCQARWLAVEGDRLRLTDQGVLFSNEVFAGFLEEK